MAEKRLDITVAAKALGIDATEQQLKKLTRTMREAQGGAGGGGRGFFGGLQSGLGRGSTFKESIELLAGGGAVAGLGLAGSVLNSAAEKVRDIAVEFALGKKSGGELVEELAKSIPIYGNIIAAGRTLRGIFDGTAIAIAKMNEETKRTNELLGEQAKLINETRQGQLRAAVVAQGGESNADAIKRAADEAIREVKGDDTRSKRRDELNARILQAQQDEADALGGAGVSDHPGGKLTKGARERREKAQAELAIVNRAEADKIKSIEAERDAQLMEEKRRRADAKRQFDADLLGRKADVESKIPFKQIQAERDAIREKYARDEASLAKQLRDPNLTLEQKKKLRDIQEALPAAMRDELFNAGLRKTHNRSEFDSQLRTTGAGDAAARKMDDLNKKVDGLNRLLAAIERNTRQTTSNTGPQVAR